jgi:hypothetical protein
MVAVADKVKEEMEVVKQQQQEAVTVKPVALAEMAYI